MTARTAPTTIDTRLLPLLIAALVVAWMAAWVVIFGLPGFGGPGGDFGTYMAIGDRVLDGGPLYLPHQLAGPYVTQPGDSMYPPTTAPLFLVFAALPEFPARVAWYWIPVAIYAWAMWRLRPQGWAGVVALLLIASPTSLIALWVGNPVIWCGAAMAVAALYRWPAVLVLLKPSLFPFAVIGLRDRRGWVVLVGFVVVGLLTLPLVLEWISVVLNARGPYSGPLYSLAQVPLLVAPFVASGAVHPRVGLIVFLVAMGLAVTDSRLATP